MRKLRPFLILLIAHCSLFTDSAHAQNFWQQTNGPYGGFVSSIAIDSSGYVFAATVGGGVFLSTNNGTSWTAVNSGLTDTDVFSLAVSPNRTGGTTIFAGTYCGGVFLSTNNGTSWTQTGILRYTSCIGGSVTALAVSGTNIFAAGYDDYGRSSIFLSTNNGTTWTQTGSPNMSVYALTVSGTNLLAGTDGGGVFLSTNNGTSWTQTSLTSGGVFAFAASGSKLFAASSGVFLSTDNGISWTRTGLTNTTVYALAVSDTNLFAGTYGGGIFLSTNNGTSWTAVNSGLTNIYVWSLAVSGANLFAGTYDGVFLSTNKGTSWTQTGLTNSSVYALAVSGSNLFAGTSRGGVFLSTNDGTSWTRTGLTNTTVYALAVSDTNLFAGTYGGGIFLSTNNGTSWTKTGFTSGVAYAFAVSGSKLFTGGSGGVFLSTNSGTSWTAVNTGLTTADVRSLAVSGINLFAGTDGGGVYLSTNDGTSWTAVNTGLANTSVWSLTLSGGNLFAGTNGGGVYLSTNNGASWTAINTGLTTLPNTTVTCIVSSGYLFAGTRGGGRSVYLSLLGHWYSRQDGSGVFRSVQAFVPTAPTLSSPTNGATNQPTTLTLSWHAVSDAVKYRLQVSTSAAFTPPLMLDDSSLTTTSQPVASLANSTTYYWRVAAGNVSGWSGFSSAFSFSTAALVAPTLVSPTNSQTNRPTTLTLSWNASTGAATYRLQVSTSSTFTTAIFDDSTITGTSKSIGPLAYSTTYYWRAAARGAGGSSSFSEPYSFSTLSQKTVTSPGISFPSDPTSSNDYRLVSFPGTQTLQVSQIFSGSQNQDWRIFTDNGGSPPNHLSELNSGSTLEVGKGYWLVQKGTFVFSRSVTMPPLSEDGTSSISLRSGWNIIGLPFDEAVSTNAVIAANGLPSNTKFWTYAGSQGFQSVSQIEPFKGYYFNNTQGRAALKIPYPFPSMKITAPPAPPIEWKLQIVVESQTNQDAENFVGIAPSSSNALDALDEQKPPFFADQTVLYFSRPEWDKRYRWFSTDFRPAVGEGQVWDFEVSNPRHSHGTIRVVGVENVPAEYEVILLNASNTVPVSLRESAEYRYQTVSEKMSFRLVVGKRGFVNDEMKKTVPSEFALEQNYPNPFNPSTSISFKLPREAQIRLEVISLLGQSIALLAEGRYPPGTHTVVWNSSDHNNGRSSSGVYLYRLVVDGSVLQTKKMILLQ